MSAPIELRALRGATTASENSVSAITAAVDELIAALVDRNGLVGDRILSVTFSVTADLDACFPAAIARRRPGWDGIQLTAYALAHNEVHGTNIRKGVVMMSVRPADGAEPEYQEFVLEPDDFDMWTQRWCDRVGEYYRVR